MQEKIQKRTGIFIAVIVLLLLLFMVKLMQMQIVSGEEYLAQAEGGSSRTIEVSAARGEIVDRYAEPLVQNQMGFNVIFDAGSMIRSHLNDYILELCALFREQGESWNDSLPIEAFGEGYRFIEGRESAVSRLKRELGIADYATADDAMAWLIEENNIDTEGLSRDEIRTVAGVRYEMALKDYSVANPYTFAEDISMTTAILVTERSNEMPGVLVMETPIRAYVAEDIASNVIGFVGAFDEGQYTAEWREAGYSLNDQIGKTGLEAAYESELRGQNGVRRLELDGDNLVIGSEDITPAQPGNTIVSTIDKSTQEDAQRILAEGIADMAARQLENEEEIQANAGAMVVLDVETFGVIAAANYPTYNLETYQEDYASLLQNPANPLFDRSFSGLYAPGSCFKPAVATATLAEGVMDANDTVDCTGRYTRFADYQPTCMGVHGSIDVREALAVSCNIYFYEAGYQLGIEPITRYANTLGLGVKTGVEINEATGRISNREFVESLGNFWTDGQIVSTAIGQSETVVTPLQLATLAASIANDGVRLQTHLVSSVMSYNLDQTIWEHTPTVMAEVEDKDAIRVVQEGMLECTLSGSARYYFQDCPIRVAAKTGTPQTETNLNAIFIAYAPYEDPQIAVACVVEKGGGGYMLAPMVRELIENYFARQQGTMAGSDEQLPTTEENILLP